MDLFSGSIHSLENALNRANVKQKVISENIANLDTPNYKSKEVSFSNILKNESEKLNALKTNERHLDFLNSGPNYSIVTNSKGTYQQNGNNVDIDQEMSKLAQNQIEYQALVDRLSGKFNSLKTAITGGKA
ncbi:flagellar basal body rod protein FlgB [Bacillus gobiensis]|uniref:flagellar basal body rod protein FlgB n=1 Tax=Bacillus gobiensis TaxID=1441095 RepID=UPI003D256E99